MERHGFIHDILDVKLLILYVMSMVETPVSSQTIYELCFQDECLSYFDVQEAIPQMVETGHLEQIREDRYLITKKGRETEEITHDSIAFPVKERAKAAVEKLNSKQRREKFIRTEILPREAGDYSVVMALDDTRGQLMRLELTVPNLQQARRVEGVYHRGAEELYQTIMVGLLAQVEKDDTENS